MQRAQEAYDRATRQSDGRDLVQRAHPTIRSAFANYLSECAAGRGLTEEAIGKVRRVIAELEQEDAEIASFDRMRLRAEARLFDLLSLTDPKDFNSSGVMELFGELSLCGASPGRRREVASDLHTVAELLKAVQSPASDSVAEIADEFGRAAEA